MKIKFQCPKCTARPNEHGVGACAERGKFLGRCPGFICECDSPTSDEPDHGQSFTNLCSEAVCFHCGWSGTFPVKPKSLLAWEKKALDAGWKMPPARAAELSAKSAAKGKRPT